MTAQNQKSVEQRRSPRRRMLKAGRIVNQELGVTFPVSVRNMSAEGARIDVMVVTVPIPKHFTLELPLDGMRVDCEVLWRNGVQFGVAFTGPVTEIPRQREQIVGMTRMGELIQPKTPVAPAPRTPRTARVHTTEP